MEWRLVKIDEREEAELLCRGWFPNISLLQPATTTSGSETPAHRPSTHKIKAVGAPWLENITERPVPAGIHYRGSVCLGGHSIPLPAIERKSSFSLLWPSLAGDNNVSKCHGLQQAAALLFVFKARHADSELQARLVLATAQRNAGVREESTPSIKHCHPEGYKKHTGFLTASAVVKRKRSFYCS